MRKTNKNLTKQILTLMLAFVMVFTGMGIGSWGVDQAWAEEDSFSKIAKINYTAYNKKGKIIAAYSFTTDNEKCTATCKTIESFRSLSKISERITLIDEEEKTIGFDNMSITLNGTTINTWAWEKDSPTELKLTIAIGGKTKEYFLSFIYDAPYFKTLLYNYGQWTRFSYQEGVDEYKDTGIGLTVRENVAKASELKLEGCTGRILKIESDYCEPKDSCATINSDGVSAVVNWYKANGEIRITISNSGNDTTGKTFTVKSRRRHDVTTGASEHGTIKKIKTNPSAIATDDWSCYAYPEDPIADFRR